MLALDANILVRAVLGKRARRILEAYTGVVQFLAADVAVEEARSPALSVLDALVEKLEVIDLEVYAEMPICLALASRLGRRTESRFSCAHWFPAELQGRGINNASGCWSAEPGRRQNASNQKVIDVGQVALAPGLLGPEWDKL